MSFEIKRTFSEPVMDCLTGGVNLWIEYDTYNNSIKDLDIYIQPMKLWKEAINIAEQDEKQQICDEISERYIELECELTKETVGDIFYCFSGMERETGYIKKEVSQKRYEEMAALKQFAKTKGCNLSLISWDDLRTKIANTITSSFAEKFDNLLPFTIDFFVEQFDNDCYSSARFGIEGVIVEFFEFLDNKLNGYELLVQKMVSVYKACKESYTKIAKDIEAVQKLDVLRNGLYTKYPNNRLCLDSFALVNCFYRKLSFYYRKELEKEKFEALDQKYDELYTSIENIEKELESVKRKNQAKELEIDEEINGLTRKSKSIIMLFKRDEKNALLEKIKECEKKKESLKSQHNKQCDLLNDKLKQLRSEKDSVSERQNNPFFDWSVIPLEELYE